MIDVKVFVQGWTTQEKRTRMREALPGIMAGAFGRAEELVTVSIEDREIDPLSPTLSSRSRRQLVSM